jgi:hypothetical protein
MNQGFFEVAQKNSAQYDRVHEYCTCEQVNEELLRVSIREERSLLRKISQLFSGTLPQKFITKRRRARKNDSECCQVNLAVK